MYAVVIRTRRNKTYVAAASAAAAAMHSKSLA